VLCFFFSSRRRHTSSYGDWSSDVCSSDLGRCRVHRHVERERSGAARGYGQATVADRRPQRPLRPGEPGTVRPDRSGRPDGAGGRSEERRVGKGGRGGGGGGPWREEGEWKV